MNAHLCKYLRTGAGKIVGVRICAPCASVRSHRCNHCTVVCSLFHNNQECRHTVQGICTKLDPSGTEGFESVCSEVVAFPQAPHTGWQQGHETDNYERVNVEKSSSTHHSPRHTVLYMTTGKCNAGNRKPTVPTRCRAVPVAWVSSGTQAITILEALDEKMPKIVTVTFRWTLVTTLKFGPAW